MSPANGALITCLSQPSPERSTQRAKATSALAFSLNVPPFQWAKSWRMQQSPQSPLGHRLQPSVVKGTISFGTGESVPAEPKVTELNKSNTPRRQCVTPQ